MKSNEIAQFIIYMVALIGLAPILGSFMAKVLAGERNFLAPILGPIEKLIYKIGGVKGEKEMDWKQYLWALMIFNILGIVVLILIQVFQADLPLNPAKMPNVPFALALNTAVSFTTNTDWQAYSGEASLSYFTQMIGLGVQNFLCAATGLAVMVAMARGFARKNTGDLGNFWADLVRSTLYILLPLSIIFAVVLVSQGVVQNFRNYDTATIIAPYEKDVPKVDAKGAAVVDDKGQPVMEKQTVTDQTIPQGPAASQVAIKQLGTNGGGFFGVNSAHPFENPTPFSNFLEMLAILALPAACCFTYGKFVGDAKQGRSIYYAMMIIFLVGLAIAWWAEVSTPHPMMEGKETRFGVMNSVLWATATTDASNGSVNAMHDSLSPLAGLVTVTNILLGECVFGGIGTGLYTILMHVIVTVFIAGLMVGRTPEYLGKKIEAREVRLAILAIIAPCAFLLVGSAISAVNDFGTSSLANQGPHGLTEILYAFASAANNNGSAFAGINVNTPWYLYSQTVCMFVGRFIVIFPALAIAGSLAQKKTAPFSAGTFPTTGGTFVILLIGVIVIVGALTFFPVLCLGPVIEHFLMPTGRLF